MYYVGIDIGSTASKTVVMDAAKNEILARKLMPSGWNSREKSWPGCSLWGIRGKNSASRRRGTDGSPSPTLTIS